MDGDIGIGWSAHSRPLRRLWILICKVPLLEKPVEAFPTLQKTMQPDSWS
jgi:hypothetical protein